MQRFLFQLGVKNAEGSQTWYVDAVTRIAAIDILKAGGGDIYESEVDVTALGEPEFLGTTSLDDYGDAEAPIAADEITDNQIIDIAYDVEALLTVGPTETELLITIVRAVLARVHPVAVLEPEPVDDMINGYFAELTEGKLTCAVLADALDCFWNAAVFGARDSDDIVVVRTVGAVAQGIAAVSTHLRSVAK